MRTAALILPVLILTGADAPPSAGRRAVPVETRAIAARELVYAVEATGSLETDLKQVCAEVAGVVRELAFEEGDEVDPGKVLAAIDPETYGLRARKAKAAFDRAEAQRQEAELALERRGKLRGMNEGWVSGEEILQHESRLKESQAAAEEARLLWKLAEEDERRSQVRAPAAGRIERRHVVQGQFLQAGAPVASLVDPGDLRLRFKVAGLEAARLSKGQALTFKVRELPGEAFQGSVFHIASRADPATRSVECVARVEKTDARLKAGQFAEAHLEVGRQEKAVTVPEGALLPTERGYVVFIVDGADGKTARRRPVTLGLHTADGEVEVLSGLSAGEVLVVRGAQLLTDGAAIAPRAAAAP